MQSYNFTFSFVWVWNLAPHTKGRTYIEGAGNRVTMRIFNGENCTTGRFVI
jgi:hypothetical protein